MKVIAAEGEKKASQALREAADTISESPAALQLRYLQVRLRGGKQTRRNIFNSQFQTLNSISAEKNSTIIFPFPMDLVGHLFNKNWFFSRILKKSVEKRKRKLFFIIIYIIERAQSVDLVLFSKEWLGRSQCALYQI